MATKLLKQKFKGAVPEVEADDLIYIPPGDTITAFHKSDAFVRGIRGPVGSGKSTACLQELFTRGIEQKPRHGRRRTRFGVVRNTYPELKSTTIKTFQDWFPFAPVVYDVPIRSNMMFSLPDGTVVEMEWIFLSMDEASDIRKLKSLELTGVFFNEAGEIAREHIDMGTQRVRRFPRRIANDPTSGPTWTGVIMDTNPPDSDSWWYELETNPPHNDDDRWEFFIQPPGMLRDINKGWIVNPHADNIANLDPKYYPGQILGKDSEWIRVFIGNEFGTLTTGKPVYPNYNDLIHCAHITPMKDLPVIVGLDYGRSPAAVFTQLTPRGQLRILSELVGEDMGIGSFARDALLPHIATNYPDFTIMFSGDPAGLAKESDERSAFDILLAAGVVATPASTNTLTGRLEAVNFYLSILCDGQPGLIVAPHCSMIRKGFIGKYCYERVSTNKAGVYKTIPCKDKYSHPHDALQYASLRARMEGPGAKMFDSKLEYGASGLRTRK